MMRRSVRRSGGFALLEMLLVSLLLAALLFLFFGFLRNNQESLADQAAASQLAGLINDVVVPVVENGNQCLSNRTKNIPDCVPSIKKQVLDQMAKLGFDIHFSEVHTEQPNHLTLFFVKNVNVIDARSVPYLSDVRIQRIFHQALAGLSSDTLSCLDAKNGSPFSYSVTDATFTFTVRPGC